MSADKPSSDPSTAHPATAAGLKEWLRKTRIDEVECIVPDLAGIARGKAMPSAKFAQMHATHLPVSIFFQSITGDYVDFGGEEAYTEVDLRLIPDLSTLRAIPWANDPTVQIIHDLYRHDGRPCEYAPRNVLKKILGQYEEMGLKPVIAPEMEFYLTKRNTNSSDEIEPPIGRSGRQGIGRQAYSIAAVDEYDGFIEDIYDFSEAQGLEIDTVIQEGGAGQLEINLLHGDPLDLADQVFVFKRTIREAALRQNCYATFMAKPMANEPGSAMHIHQSVVDIQTGRNVFSGEDGRETGLFYRFLAGQQHYLAAVTCILAPYVNSYRRLVPGESAPINLEWGVDNRSVGLRVPISEPAGRRVENRVAGADTNPYLAIAACLACGFLGLKNKLEPRAAITGSAYDSAYGLPRSLQGALSLFEASDEVQDLLGRDFCALYRAIKHHEFEEHQRVISPWEREYLLLTV